MSEHKLNLSKETRDKMRTDFNARKALKMPEPKSITSAKSVKK